MTRNFFDGELLSGMTAVVTGASGGIGRGIVSELSKAGAAVALVDANEVSSPLQQFGSKRIGGYDSALAIAGEMSASGRRAAAIECDVTSEKQVRAMVRKAVETLGRIDILVNNAGALTMGPVAELKEEEWDTVMDSNAKGAFLCSKHVIPLMVERRFGRIINISSTSGLKGYPGQGHYCASKFAVIGFTETLALELAPHNVTANVVCPGIVASQMWRMIAREMKSPGESPEGYFKRAVDTFVPLKRTQTPEDIGRAVAFIAAMENVTGAVLPVSGGIHINSPSFE